MTSSRPVDHLGLLGPKKLSTTVLSQQFPILVMLLSAYQEHRSCRFTSLAYRIVLVPTTQPSLRSSPRIRSEPQRRFSAAMRRMRDTVAPDRRGFARVLRRERHLQTLGSIVLNRGVWSSTRACRPPQRDELVGAPPCPRRASRAGPSRWPGHPM